MGDSAGDGPHFQWGVDHNAFLIGSMTKPSLQRYCESRNMAMGLKFGISYDGGREMIIGAEMQVDFLDLIPVIEGVMAR